MQIFRQTSTWQKKKMKSRYRKSTGVSITISKSKIMTFEIFYEKYFITKFQTNSQVIIFKFVKFDLSKFLIINKDGNFLTFSVIDEFSFQFLHGLGCGCGTVESFLESSAPELLFFEFVNRDVV